MSKGHRSQIKRERNKVKDLRPSAKLSFARIPVQKACFVLDAIRGKDLDSALAIVMYNPRYASTVIEKLLKSETSNSDGIPLFNTVTFQDFINLERLCSLMFLISVKNL